MWTAIAELLFLSSVPSDTVSEPELRSCLRGQMRGMECVLPSQGCHSPLLSSAIRSQSRSYSWTTSGDRPCGRECCDASLQTSCGGQRVDTLPLRRLLHPSPSILPGIMAAGHASRYKTGLRSEPSRYRYLISLHRSCHAANHTRIDAQMRAQEHPFDPQDAGLDEVYQAGRQVPIGPHAR